jgi:hypothetical protein
MFSHVIKKLKLSHYTPWRRLGGEEVYLLLILDLGTREGWVVSVTPRPRFSPGERTPGTHCTGGWVGLRAGLDTEATGKILCPRRGSSLDRPVVQPVARHYTDWATRLIFTCHAVYKEMLYILISAEIILQWIVLLFSNNKKGYIVIFDGIYTTLVMY